MPSLDSLQTILRMMPIPAVAEVVAADEVVDAMENISASKPT